MEFSSLFAVIIVSEASKLGEEFVDLGMLDKFWMSTPELGLAVFKADSPMGTTAWSEKIASELARAIGLPTVSYELGIDWQGNRGVISPNFLKAGEIELAGADLLSLVYGKDNYYYTLENSINALAANNIKLPISWAAPPQITTAAELFAGYLMLDAWICNIDRHDYNWGVRVDPSGSLELLPNFDCGASLGVQMSGSEIVKLGLKADRCSSMMGAAICRRTERAAENFNFPDLARELLDIYPTAASYWIGKIGAISLTIVSDLFERIPADWIDLASKEFAIDLLEFNRQQLTSMIVNFKPKE